VGVEGRGRGRGGEGALLGGGRIGLHFACDQEAGGEGIAPGEGVRHWEKAGGGEKKELKKERELPFQKRDRDRLGHLTDPPQLWQRGKMGIRASKAHLKKNF